MTNVRIIAAAKLIAKFDKALSDAFLKNPFQRHRYVTAMYPGVLKRYGEETADLLSAFIRGAIDSTMPTDEEIAAQR